MLKRLPLWKKIRLSAGVTVGATTIDARSASEYDSARGRKKEPDRPSSVGIGDRATSISVA